MSSVKWKEKGRYGLNACIQDRASFFFLFNAANAASARWNEVQSSCALPYLKAHSAKSLIKPETSLKHKSNLFSPEKYNLKNVLQELAEEYINENLYKNEEKEV